jgi:hypothetical protein
MLAVVPSSSFAQRHEMQRDQVHDPKELRFIPTIPFPLLAVRIGFSVPLNLSEMQSQERITDLIVSPPSPEFEHCGWNGYTFIP